MEWVTRLTWVTITDEMRKAAWVASENIPAGIMNSIRKGEGRYVGCLGEEMVQAYFGPRWRMDRTFNWDGWLDGIATDVKTKETKVTPLPYYLASVADANIKQECDLYLFTRVHKSLNYGWIIGGYKKEAFLQDSFFGVAGEVDPTATNGWRFKADCHNMEFDRLHVIK